MTKVNLPPGCYGFETTDGTKYDGKPGGSVDIADHHARDITKGQYGQQGFISAAGALAFGTKKGRACTNPLCRRIWNAWNETCHSCGSTTEAR